MKFKSLLYSTLAGNVLEFYNLGLFGFLAPIIGTQFFPTKSLEASIITAFGVYAIGFISRPLGAIVFGHIGDKYGRKTSLSFTVFCTSLPTLIIAFLPTYNVLGVVSPVILIICRFAQGMCTGGEFNGSAIFLLEHYFSKKSSFYSSMLTSAAIFGLFLAAFISLILLQDFMPTWAWRIGFLIGSTVAMVGWQISKKLLETPEYLIMVNQRKLCKLPLMEIFKQYKLPSLCTFGIGWIVGCSSLTLIALPAFLTKIIGIPDHIAYYTNALSIILYIFATLFAGFLGDKYKPQNIILFAAISLTLFAYPIYFLFNTTIISCAIIGQIMFAIITGAIVGPYHALLFKLFPPAVRYTGISFNFSLGLALFGSSAPLITASITYYFGNAIYSSFYMAFGGVIGILSILTILFNNLDCKDNAININKPLLAN